MPVASTAVLADKTEAFYAEIRGFAARHGIPVVEFASGPAQRRRDAGTPGGVPGRGPDRGVVFVGRAQEKVRCSARPSAATPRAGPTRGSSGPAGWSPSGTSTAMTTRCGPFFLKYCGYFPYNAKLCCNGTSTPSGWPPGPGSGLPRWTTGSPPAMTWSGPGDLRHLRRGRIEALAARWLDILPCPFTPPTRGRVPVRDLRPAGRVLPHPGPRQAGIRADLLRAGHPRQPRPRPARPGRADLRPADHPQGQAGHAGEVPHPRPDRRGHPVAARRLQALEDQAVPQGRQGTQNRNHDQRHPRLRHRQTAD